MRNLALAFFALATVAVAGPAVAQTYNPAYPVCLHVYGPITYYECNFASLAQCAGAAAGRAAQCEINPYFAGPQRHPRQRLAY